MNSINRQWSLLECLEKLTFSVIHLQQWKLITYSVFPSRCFPF